MEWLGDDYQIEHRPPLSPSILHPLTPFFVSFVSQPLSHLLFLLSFVYQHVVARSAACRRLLCSMHILTVATLLSLISSLQCDMICLACSICWRQSCRNGKGKARRHPGAARRCMGTDRWFQRTSTSSLPVGVITDVLRVHIPSLADFLMGVIDGCCRTCLSTVLSDITRRAKIHFGSVRKSTTGARTWRQARRPEVLHIASGWRAPVRKERCTYIHILLVLQRIYPTSDWLSFLDRDRHVTWDYHSSPHPFVV